MESCQQFTVSSCDSEPQTSLCGVFWPLAPSVQQSLVTVIVRLWCAQLRIGKLTLSSLEGGCAWTFARKTHHFLRQVASCSHQSPMPERTNLAFQKAHFTSKKAAGASKLKITSELWPIPRTQIKQIFGVWTGDYPLTQNYDLRKIILK